MQILYFILVFFLGVLTGSVLLTRVLMRYSRRTGTIFVTDAQGMKTFLLELNDDPEKIEDKNLVIFRVEKGAPDNRE